MPTLTIRRPEEVPSPSRSPRSVREAQALYEGFIQAIDGDVGDLELAADEQARSVKVRLRRAATRLGREIDIWELDGHVYFSLTTKRGRPRKTSA
jgi:hypothetical protein